MGYEGRYPEDGEKIKYGDFVRLYHEFSGRFISTDGSTYEGGSGQRRVFSSDKDTDWILTPVSGSSEEEGNEVAYDDQVTFVNKHTGENLHSSPGVESPITSKQEVSAFSGDDDNDKWVVIQADDDIQDGFWRVGENIYLVHAASDTYLQSHDAEFDDGSYEVFTSDEHDTNSIWSVPSN
ncbi:MIR motif-containing protein [Absidia repens]|uniref:MIR motif-containing protein n=1 Tax=Absidia repens TaxID=90262 RepID=A0A1X2IMM3_9FUNG|nr:MIR motif-containing protein [Absidia repens]